MDDYIEGTDISTERLCRGCVVPRKTSRRATAVGAAECLTPSSPRETLSAEVSERLLVLLQSTRYSEAKKAVPNDGAPPVVGQTNDECEFNDFIECLGYLPPEIKPVNQTILRRRKHAGKRVECLCREVEEGEFTEFNDFIECLGYPPPRG
jgi:hypothetical protein